MNAIKKAARQGLLFIAYDSLVDQIFCRLFQLRKRFPFDLPDAFAGHIEVFSHFFESPCLSVFQPEAQLEHLSFSFRQPGQKFFDLLAEKDAAGGIIRRDGFMVFDEISQMGIFLFADRRFQRNRVLCDLFDLAYLGE